MSTYYDILESVRARVRAISHEIEPVVRKRPIFLMNDSLPAIIISPGPGGEAVDMETFGKKVQYRYPVTVTLVTAGDRVFEIDVASSLELREKIRQTLYQPILDGAASVIDATIELDPPFSISGSATAVYDVTSIRLTFLSFEERLH